MFILKREELFGFLIHLITDSLTFQSRRQSLMVVSHLLDFEIASIFLGHLESLILKLKSFVWNLKSLIWNLKSLILEFGIPYFEFETLDVEFEILDGSFSAS